SCPVAPDLELHDVPGRALLRPVRLRLRRTCPRRRDHHVFDLRPVRCRRRRGTTVPDDPRLLRPGPGPRWRLRMARTRSHTRMAALHADGYRADWYRRRCASAGLRITHGRDDTPAALRSAPARGR